MKFKGDIVIIRKVVITIEKWNLRNKFNHHFNEFLSIGFVLSGIIVGILGVLVGVFKVESIDLKAIAEGLVPVNELCFTFVLIIFQFASLQIVLTMVKYQPPKHLIKIMLFPIIVAHTLVGIGRFLTDVDVFNSYDSNLFYLLYIFVSSSVYFYGLDYMLYGYDMKKFKEELELDNEKGI